MPISTRDLSKLPGISELERITKALAILDAILCPEWEYRYFSFNAAWDASAGERMASMRNGSRDEYFLLFTTKGAIMKGFNHESEMSRWANKSKSVWPGVLEAVPPDFSSFLTEPAFSLQDTTFCVWRTFADAYWRCGNISFPEAEDPDGSEGLLWALEGDADNYCKFAREYFEIDPDRDAVDEIFKHGRLTSELIRRINPKQDLADLLADASEIEYPIG